VRETVRKVERTFANGVALQEQAPAVTPRLVFAASSAQQYAWLAEHYPALFERVRTQVAAGRFVPVGGMWGGSDTNMPGGGRGAGRGRPVRAGRGDVGGVGHQHAGWRGAGPPVRGGQAVLPGAVRSR